MTNHFILVDGNNWGFAGMQGPKLSAGEKDTQAIFTVMKKARYTVEQHPTSHVIVLWDGKSWRKDIYPEYKANRTKTDKQNDARSAYKEQVGDIKKGLSLLGIRQMSANNLEADDLAYSLVKKLNSIGGRVTLLTADQDWQQLVNPQTVWVDGIHGKRCDIHNFEDITGFLHADQFIEAKAILGDAGDNVKGLNGVGEGTLSKIYQDYQYFSDFLNDLQVGRAAEIDAWKERHGKVMPKVLRELDVDAAFETLNYNLKLVDLGTDARPATVGLRDDKGKLDEEAFEGFCYKLAFMSITKDFDRFMLPFKENKYVSV